MDENNNQRPEDRPDQLQNPPSEQPPRRAFSHRLRSLAKDHPLTLLAGAAAVGVLAGVEVAAGALMGIGAVALLATDAGRDLREKVRARGRGLLRRRPAQAPPAQPAPSPA
jgi:hypothetical protein